MASFGIGHVESSGSFFYLVSRLKCNELFLHAPIRLHNLMIS